MFTIKGRIKSIVTIFTTLVIVTACNEQGSKDQSSSGANSSNQKVSALKALLADPNLFQEALASANSLNADPDYSLTADELSFLQSEGLLTADEAAQLAVLVAHN